MATSDERKQWEADILHSLLTKGELSPEQVQQLSAAMLETREAAELATAPTWYTDPVPDHTKRRLCWLRLRRHTWSEPYDRGQHRWKICVDCGRNPRTHHLSCPPACWAGPA